jgi:hypothetical protein
VITDKTFPTNKPDIIIDDSIKRHISCGYGNSKRWKRYQEKNPNILKYKYLTTETQFLWNVKSKFLPVKVGTNGIDTK